MSEAMMSLHPIDGTVLPSYGHSSSIRERISGAFRRAMAGSRSPAKELARTLGRTPKGAELLLRGENAPSLETIIIACRELDDVWDEFKVLCGRAETESEAETILAEFAARLRERRPE